MRSKRKLQVSDTPPYDLLGAFVRENHIALPATGSGELDGLVFAAKDVFEIKGSKYSNGHPKWLESNPVSEETSPAIELLLQAGADLVGKTVCDELCYSISGENWHYGSPINPVDPSRFTGGSSSGSAAAVAGDLVDFSIGSDCLGSVRVPASYCGVYGMRPTYGRINNKGEAPYCASMDVLGFIAKEASVMEKVGRVLLGDDPRSFDLNHFFTFDFLLDFNPEFKAFIKEHPIEIIQFPRDELISWVKTFQIVQGYEVWESYGEWYQSNDVFINRGPKERLEFASSVTRKSYLEGLKEKQVISNQMDDLLGENKIMLLPTASSVAIKKDEELAVINKIRSDSSQLLCISPLSGTPQITIPLLESEGVPFGLSLLGPRDSDSQLLKIATKMGQSL